MSKNLSLLLIVIVILLASCSDDVTKSEEINKFPRIEFSKCTSCYECIENFHCPYEAIRIDEQTHQVYIDQDRCVKCYDCLNAFKCDYDAITRLEDVIPPAAPRNLSVVSDSIGMVEINFTAPGDDSLFGRAYQYDLHLYNLSEEELDTSFVPGLPKISGAPESWRIKDLPAYDTLNVVITAIDEVGLESKETQQEIAVLGEYIDVVAPEAITDLTALSTEYSIKLNWTSPADPDSGFAAAEYMIKSSAQEINESNWNSAELINHALIPQEPGSIEELLLEYTQPSGELYFAIKSVDHAGNISRLSNITSGEATTDITAPGAITDLVAFSTEYSITLNWTAPADPDPRANVTSYIIKSYNEAITDSNWEIAEEIPHSITPSNPGNVETLLLEYTEPSGFLYFCVRSTDANGNLSEVSNIASGEATTDITVPLTITDLAAISTEYSITLNWTAPADPDSRTNVASYIIRSYSEEITDSNWNLAEEIQHNITPSDPGSIETLLLEYTEPSGFLYFCIRSTDANSNLSEVSNNATGEATTDITAPAAITDLATGSPGYSSIPLIWTAPGDNGMIGTASYYEIRYSLYNITAGNWDAAQVYEILIIPQTAGSTETAVVEGLLADTQYFFAIKAFDEVDNASDLSNTVLAITESMPDTTPPDAITDLSAAAMETSIELSWTATGDDGTIGVATQYILYYAQQEITPANQSSATIYEGLPYPAQSGSMETCTIDFLAAGVNWYFALEARDEEANSSGLSNNTSAMIAIDETPPGQITDLSAVLMGMEVQLNWTAPGDDGIEGIANSYDLRRHTEVIDETNWESAIQIAAPNPATAGTNESVMLTGLDYNIDWYFAIKASDDAGNESDLSNIATAFIEFDDIAPAVISDLATELDGFSVTLTWTAPGDDAMEGTADSYDLRKLNFPINETNWSSAIQITVPSPATAGSTESITLTDLDYNMNWYFAIKATDEVGNESDLSNLATAYIEYDEIPPAAVEDLSAEIAGTDLTLTWTAPGDDGIEGTADSYDLRMHTEVINNSNWESAQQLPVSAPSPGGSPESILLTEIEPGIIWYFALKAADENGNISEVSNNCSALISDDQTAPGMIDDLSVTTGQASYVNRMTINWTAPGDDGNSGTCSAYEIRYYNVPITAANWDNATNFDSPPTPQAAGSTESCQITGLNSGQIYYFAVRALDEAGNISEVSPSPGGKIVYQINSSLCRDCHSCINQCDQNAIYDAGAYKAIDPDLCIACGDCLVCNFGAIHLWVIGY